MIERMQRESWKKIKTVDAFEAAFAELQQRLPELLKNFVPDLEKIRSAAISSEFTELDWNLDIFDIQNSIEHAMTFLQGDVSQMKLPEYDKVVELLIEAHTLSNNLFEKCIKKKGERVCRLTLTTTPDTKFDPVLRLAVSVCDKDLQQYKVFNEIVRFGAGVQIPQVNQKLRNEVNELRRKIIARNHQGALYVARTIEDELAKFAYPLNDVLQREFEPLFSCVLHLSQGRI